MFNLALYSRLKAISDRDADDRSISPGEASYLLKVLNESGEKFDLTYDQIVQLHQHEILTTNEARSALGLPVA